VDGFLCIDKPVGVTTFAIVRHVRRALCERRVGHAGTLDPPATGLVVVALGKAPRLLPYLHLEPKQYEFEIRFGVETDTLDNTGRETARSHLVPDEAALRLALSRFTGVITQSPPRFSAVKIHGQRAYDLARQNATFETRPRQVRIDTLALLAYDGSRGVACCRVSCSGGTYVRVLAADIARALGTYAHAAGIRRVAAGGFSIAKAIALESEPPRMAESVVAIYDAFEGQPRVELGPAHIADVVQGRRIRLDTDAQGAEIVVAFDTARDLVGVLQRRADGWWQPVRVLSAPQPLTERA
jgi:tRNA pseudouridine55 synthase